MIFKSRSWLEAGVCLPKALKEPLKKYTSFSKYSHENRL